MIAVQYLLLVLIPRWSSRGPEDSGHHRGGGCARGSDDHRTGLTDLLLKRTMRSQKEV